MAWFDAHGIAKIVHAEYRAIREQLATLRPTPPPKPVGFTGSNPSSTCSKCGCDKTSCEQWGCTPPDDSPQTISSIQGRGDAHTAHTNYERGGMR